MKNLLITLIWLGVLLLTVWLVGCTTDVLLLPNGIEVRHNRGVTDAKAKRVEIYYEDPNTVLWIIVNDPNSRVHPAKLIVPPYMMIEMKDDSL